MFPTMSHSREVYSDSRLGLLVAAGQHWASGGQGDFAFESCSADGEGRTPALLSLSGCTIISLLHHGSCWYRFKQAVSDLLEAVDAGLLGSSISHEISPSLSGLQGYEQGIQKQSI